MVCGDGWMVGYAQKLKSCLVGSKHGGVETRQEGVLLADGAELHLEKLGSVVVDSRDDGTVPYCRC